MQTTWGERGGAPAPLRARLSFLPAPALCLGTLPRLWSVYKRLTQAPRPRASLSTPPCRRRLGKTMQCAAFLAGLLSSGLVRRALVVAPKTLLAHWAKELAGCGAGAATHDYHGDSRADRGAALAAVLSRRGGGGGVLLTTYGMVLHNAAALAAPPRGHDPDEDGPLWDLMILDEVCVWGGAYCRTAAAGVLAGRAG